MISASPGGSGRSVRPSAGRHGRAEIRRILCTTDLTSASDAAIAHAAMLAAAFGAELTVYHSIDLRKVARKSARGMAMADALRRAEFEATRLIAGHLEHAGASARVRVEYGLAPTQAVVAAIAAARP